MHIVRWIVGATVFLALLFLSLQNSDTATLKFFNLASWTAPLVVVVFIAFASGVALGCWQARCGRHGFRGRSIGFAATSAPRYGHAQSIGGNGPRYGAGDGPGFTRSDRLPDGL
jgi:hypothetical protein